MHIYGIVMSTGGTKRKGKEGWGAMDAVVGFG